MKAQIEKIHPASRESFICRRFKEKRFDHPFHFHPEVELTFIVASSGTRIVGDHIGNFDPGDLCLIGENLPHIYRNTHPSDRLAESEVLHISQDCMHGFLDTTPELYAFSELLERSKLGIQFDANTAQKAGSLMSEMRRANGVRRWSLFFQLIEILIEAPQTKILASPGYTQSIRLDASDRMYRAFQYIIEHFDEELSLVELARQARVSTAYFSRLFKKTTRKTYQDFLNEVRLGHACHLLVETEMPIVDVAFSSGFRNLSNFNRHFQKAYSCSPREYRKKRLDGLAKA